MSLSDDINKTSTSLANIKNAIIAKGTTPSGDITTYAAAIGDITTVENENKTVSPSTTQQSVTHSAGKTGLGTVIVNAVTSAIDSQIKPENIKKNVEILGIVGSYEGDTVRSPEVVCSRSTTWYLTSSGELFGCGANTNGQQGSGNTVNVTTFTKRADNVVEVRCSGEDVSSNSTTWYVNESGELYGCGYGTYGQQGSGDTVDVTTFTKRADNVKQIACSYRTTWYINESDELYGCGNNLYGQQGSGSISFRESTFTKRAENVKQVACSDSTTWYVNESGELYGCGNNSNGQQGGGSSSTTTFTKRADNVKQVACSEDTTWYINESGELYGCGDNRSGQQGSGEKGEGTDVLTFTKRADNVKYVACAVHPNDASGVTWYINENNELYGCGEGAPQGSGYTADVTTFTKRADNVKQVACSDYTTWYITNDSGWSLPSLYGCGVNNKGQQGSGDTTSVLVFTRKN